MSYFKRRTLSLYKEKKNNTKDRSTRQLLDTAKGETMEKWDRALNSMISGWHADKH